MLALSTVSPDSAKERRSCRKYTSVGPRDTMVPWPLRVLMLMRVPRRPYTEDSWPISFLRQVF